MTAQSIAEVDLGDGTLRWELCRPQRRNPVDPAGLRWIQDRCTELSGQTVILTGAGDEAFCAGFDLDALAEHDDPTSHPDQPLIDAVAAIRRADATFVARLGGYAIGAGVELCCACDLRIARRGVTFSVPASRLGVVYHPDGVRLLHAVFGPALTRSLLLLGRRIPARDASAAGALIDLVELEDLDAAVQRAVIELRAASPRSLTGHRDLLRQLDAEGPDAAQRQAYERLRAEAYETLDARAARRRLRPGSD